MAESFYLTTPIYYVNGIPHLGTAYTTIAADALARFERMDGYDVKFLTGLDEHGQKVGDAAAEAGMSPQEWVDGIAPKFLDTWKALNISNDDFIRTTEDRHIKSVQKLFSVLHDNGSLYKDTYKGWYCVPEETFFTNEELKDANGTMPPDGPDVQETPVCPDCGRPLEFVEEENLFFKLSDYGDKLLAYYDAHPDFIQPETRRNEVVSFVKGGLKDLSVSRTSFDWGVPIPFAKGHVSYVWFDALINYLTAVGYGDESEDGQAEFERRWPAQIHFVGKDIIRFHCVIWPAMLMAAGLPLPKRVFAHGFLLTKGEKMSKSRGNALSPLDLAKIFSVDGYRYYFLSDVQFGSDGSISFERMTQVYNSDLANAWGNLVSRALNMTKKYFGSTVPGLKPDATNDLTRDMGNPLADIAAGIYVRYAAHMNAIDYSGAMADVMELVNRANAYIEESAPWNIAKEAANGNEGANDRLAFVIYNTLEAIRIAAALLAPVMPTTSAEVWRRLGLGDVLAVTDLQSICKWGGADDTACHIVGNEVTVGDPLFPRLAKED
ncbi:MAG: methionine--tRNA ligase [Coriobacteriales bacterium]|jgi:methionyl-tRNA synthetase|nr:methionine--tRNA ligase [Coriobacteriales bacterium]